MRPDARSSNGTPLFKKTCPDCGSISMADRRRLGKPCHPCAMKRRASHGLSSHPLYRKLKQMQARCNYPSASGFAYYGGRGIKVCDEWLRDPEAFVAWAEESGYEEGLEIDRIDPDGDYEPSNCRFVPHVVNSRARRNRRCSAEQAAVVRLELANGQSVSEAAKVARIPYMSAWHIAQGNTWKEVA